MAYNLYFLTSIIMPSSYAKCILKAPFVFQKFYSYEVNWKLCFFLFMFCSFRCVRKDMDMWFPRLAKKSDARIYGYEPSLSAKILHSDLLRFMSIPFRDVTMKWYFSALFLLSYAQYKRYKNALTLSGI